MQCIFIMLTYHYSPDSSWIPYLPLLSPSFIPLSHILEPNDLNLWCHKLMSISPHPGDWVRYKDCLLQEGEEILSRDMTSAVSNVSPSLPRHQLSISPQQGFGEMCLFPFQARCLLAWSCVCSSWIGKTIAAVSYESSCPLIPRRQYFVLLSPNIWLLQSFWPPPHSMMVLELWVKGCESNLGH